MGKLIFMLLCTAWWSCMQVLATEEFPSDSELQPRQGLIGYPYANPILGGIPPSLDQLTLAAQNNPFLLQQQNPYAAGLGNLGGLRGLPNLQGLAELQHLAELQSLAELQGYSELQGLTGLQGLSGLQGANGQGLQGLSGLQGANGQGLQDSQNSFLKRIGPFGAGNPLLAQRALALRSPFLSRFGGINPGIRRNIGGQNSLQDILGLNALLGADGTAGRTSNSFNFQQQQPQQHQQQQQLQLQQHLQLQQQQPSSFTPLFTQETDNRDNQQNPQDVELTALLQMLNTLQGLPSNNRGLALATAASLPPGVGVRRLAVSPFLGRGGRFLSGPFNAGFRKRAATSEVDNSDQYIAIERVGTPAASRPDELQQLFRYLSDNPENAHHRQQDIETEADDFRFPSSG